MLQRVSPVSLWLFILCIESSLAQIYAPCTGPNEVWTKCDNNSCQRNCETFHMNLACKPICTPGCICRKGYLRNTKGICVKPNCCDVPVCPEPNQQYTPCVVPCGETCATLGQDIICNFLVCNEGCDCKPGFVKNSKGVCVSPINCDCPENQHLVECGQPCPPERCQDIGKVFKCVVNKNCKPACKCNKGYWRDSEMNCIPEAKCPKNS